MALSRRTAIFSYALLLWLPLIACGESKNGFDLSNASIPTREILQGGPPRDGIPSIDKPTFLPANEATYLSDNDRILGLNLNGDRRAYPIRILNWHEIVNDEFSGAPVAITYCPLCGTGMAFRSIVKEKRMLFGVSGLLYQSDVLFYDRETESLWSQILRKAVSGPMKGQTLEQFPIEHTSWVDWREKHPDTKVLSSLTGFNRDYTRNPYGSYSQSQTIYFDINHQAPARYHAKEQVMGLNISGYSKAYPFKELSAHGKKNFKDKIREQTIFVHWDEQNRSAYIVDDNGEPLATTVAFWFAWYTFYPTSDIFVAGTF